MTTLPLAVVMVLVAALAAPADGPAAEVEALYRAHFAHGQSFERTETGERARFAPALMAKLDADLAASKASSDEVVGLDFDPLTASQEGMDGFTVGAARITGSEASVPVELRLESERRQVEVRLVKDGGRWKVANIRYDEGDLVRILDELAKGRAKR